MPVETGSQILNYQGSAALGSGSNASIPAISKDANLDLINQTARDISYMNHANNIKLFEQKIKDRDNTLDLLATGQIAAGKIDPNDRKVYDAGKKKVSDNFYKMIQNGGLNNPTAVREYYDSVNDLKNIATWAQSRQLEFDKLNTELAQQDLPEDQQMYKEHIQKSKEQPFWNQIMPMQKAFDYNIYNVWNQALGLPITASQLATPDNQTNQTGVTQQNTITDRNGVITNTTKTTTAPLRSGKITNTKGITTTGTQINKDGSISEFSWTPEKYWDLPTILDNVMDLSATNEEASYSYEKYKEDFERLPLQQKMDALTAKNNRLAQYSQQRGLSTPEKIKFYVDQSTGQLIIEETKESFAAKTALASINGDYVEKQKPEVDYKILDNNTRIRLEAMGNANALKISRENNSSQERIARQNREARAQGGGGETTYDGTQGNSFDGMPDADYKNVSIKGGTFYNKDGTPKNGNVFITWDQLPATVKSALKAGGIEIEGDIKNTGVDAVVKNGRIESISNKKFGVVTRQDMEGVYQPKMDTEPLKGKKLKFSTPSGSDKKMSDAEYDEFLRKNGLK